MTRNNNKIINTRQYTLSVPITSNYHVSILSQVHNHENTLILLIRKVLASTFYSWRWRSSRVVATGDWVWRAHSASTISIFLVSWHLSEGFFSIPWYFFLGNRRRDEKKSGTLGQEFLKDWNIVSLCKAEYRMEMTVCAPSKYYQHMRRLPTIDVF